MRARTGETDWCEILADAVAKPGVISKAYSTFWNYSVGNQLSALFQCTLRGIEPGPIHTYGGWRELNRQVKKGERAVVLTMPVNVKLKREQPIVSDDALGGSVQNDPQTHCSNEKTIFVERPHWFVLSQTVGADYVPVPVPNWDEQTALNALEVLRVPFRHTNGNCQGYARAREVSVSPIAFLPHRTLFHELGHVVLGHTSESTDLSDADERTPRDVREVEAECVALICSESLGLPGAEFSRGYIQYWLKNQSIAEKSVHRIFKAADAVLRAGRSGSDSMDS